MKILATSYRNNIYSMQNKHTNFKGTYNDDNIEILNREMRGPILSSHGNIIVNHSTINDEILAKDGNVFIRNQSTVNGPIHAKNGNICVNNGSIVKGDISTKHGNICVNDSIVKGDISTKHSSIVINSSKVTGNLESPTEINLIDGEVEGTIKTSIDQLKLEGTNILKDIIFEDNNSTICGNNVINVSGSGGNCIVISGQNKFISMSNNGIVTINGKRINPNEISKDTKPIIPEFTLPKGNTITGTVEFKGEKEGILILEEGAKFFGKLKNGVIRHKK